MPDYGSGESWDIPAFKGKKVDVSFSQLKENQRYNIKCHQTHKMQAHKHSIQNTME